MELLQHFLPSQENLHLDSWDLDSMNHQMTFHISSTQVLACCPVCNQLAHRVHSRYERTLRDLPCVDFCLTILLQVCKFFCLNENCHRRIFTERLPQVALPWARRTVRYTRHLSEIGLALGGAAAARLSYQINYASSRNTMLRAVLKLPLPPVKTPKILGVDDFAFRRGHQYGTILVDLETHQPIGLLPDRQAETLENWLREHPGIEIISRDRSKTYKSAVTAGAPDAVQVADRFHLLQNLEEVLETVFSSHESAIKTVEYSMLSGIPVEHQTPEAMGKTEVELPLKPNSRKAQNRARRLEKYEQTHALRKQGYLIKDIAHHLGIGKRTVYTYLAADTFPEYKTHPRRGRSSALDPYKSYVLEQWKNGRHNSKELFGELQQQGFTGTYTMVVRYTRQLRQSLPPQPTRESLNELPGRGPVRETQGLLQKPLTLQRAAWLVMRKAENLTQEDESILEQLSKQPELSQAIDLAQSFLFMVRERLPQHLDSWLERAKNIALKPFEKFAQGLLNDYEAVKAALTLEVSNGPVEGQNNRLKMVKRQMYGRAALELLNKRFVLMSLCGC